MALGDGRLPQGLKPAAFWAVNGTSKAVPFHDNGLATAEAVPFPNPLRPDTPGPLDSRGRLSPQELWRCQLAADSSGLNCARSE
jgi:hypothetical protein